MRARLLVASTALLALHAARLDAQHGHGASHSAARPANDSAHKALQERGKGVMGVDQYTVTHTFDALPDGGRIELRSNSADSADVAQIRRHLREIARAFAGGDFTSPGLVHAREVPGTAVMAAKRGAITYDVRDVPAGAEVRITTADVDAIRAIHDFMAFQRADHRASGSTSTRP
jgi:hypothetical protein